MINADIINTSLEKYQQNQDAKHIKDILAKAKLAKGLDFDDVAALLFVEDPESLNELFTAAKSIKEEIYGNRIVLFAPLYISNLCYNECTYCAFRATNKALARRSLSQPEIAAETKHLIDQGHKRVLLVAGESYSREGLQYILDSIDTIYSTTPNYGTIRRVNVNIAPLTTQDFHQLKTAKIGTYQLFQETYHPEIYKQVHIAGKKADYRWRLYAIDRALAAGIDDVGIGILFGLAPWRFEILALMQHIEHLVTRFGIGPHTISVPRLEPALGSAISEHPPFAVSDDDFKKIVAILRLAIPSAGIILSTRENPDIRREVLALGVSQISAGSRTNPGGYGSDNDNSDQFSLGDHRTLDEVIRDLVSAEYLPSFCTACYRSERTGKKFMHLANEGRIKQMCSPNAILTFAEYLADYASAETQEIGIPFVAKELSKLPDKARKLTEKMLLELKSGVRDVYL